jgi:ribose transport system substrate-binding protein
MVRSCVSTRTRWTFAAVLTTAVSTLAAGCAGSAKTDTRARRAKPEIVMARVSGDPFYKTVECGALDQARKLGVSVRVEGMANYEVSEQARVLDRIIARRPDVIMTAPVDPKGVIPVFKRVKRAGIKMVTFDTTLSARSLVDTQVVTNNLEQGRLAADGLARAIGLIGKVLVVSDRPGVTTTGQEQRGFEEQIRNYPNIAYLGARYHKNDQDRGVSIVRSALAAHPDLAGVFATNTFGSEAAATAVRQANKIGRIKIVAYDTTREILQGVRTGVFAAAIAYQARREGALSVAAAVKLHKGQAVASQYTVGNSLLTSENVNDPASARYAYVTAC